MEQVYKFLQENPILYFATTTKNNRPKVRPVALMLKKDDKLYFCTSDQTSLYNDLKNNPYTEISVMSKDYVWIRISAKVVFSDDQNIKELGFSNNKQLQTFFTSADDPKFNIFFLTEGTTTLYNYAGNPTQTFTF